ncbi:MAG TPA: helix-turn-helix transcriptional regulator [Patescibacteria group bacterium]|nr:helix-turn-helix transcriptional regulator [Patescibacteria group bacterium]
MVKGLGEKIKALRKAKNISQEQLSKMCNVSRRTVINAETSKKIPTLSTLEKLASGLDTTIDNLITNN